MRLQNQLQLKMPHKKYGKWNELTAEQKALEARKMEIYAGMVENLDANVGRIIQYLKQNNLL